MADLLNQTKLLLLLGVQVIRPLQDKIVVKPQPRVKSTIIDVIMSEKDNMGTVIAVGPKAADKVQVGDFVRFGTMGNDEYLSYHEYHEGQEKYLVMSWKDVCFVQI